MAPVGIHIVGETRAGASIAVGLPQFPGVRLTYSQVTTRGITSVTAASDANCLRAPVGVIVGTCFLFTFTGAFPPGSATITLPYDPALVPSGRSEGDIRLFHFPAGASPEDITTSIDVPKKRVTGRTASFQFFGPGFAAIPVGIPEYPAEPPIALIGALAIFFLIRRRARGPSI